MKIYISLLLVLFSFASILSQSTVKNYKTKTEQNEQERTLMLDLLRARIKQEFNQEVQFVVNHFKLSNDFAWFKGDVKRLDGKDFELSEEGAYDCCHVESLFKKQDGKWIIVESVSFSTDVWWTDLSKKYPKADKNIF
jgi:hypothetical protein